LETKRKSFRFYSTVMSRSKVFFEMALDRWKILSVVVVMLGSNTVGYISNKETTYKDWQGYCKRLHSLGTNRS